jgi:hypothetical protein
VRVSREKAAVDEKCVIGKYMLDINSPTALTGKIDYVRVRGTR